MYKKLKLTHLRTYLTIIIQLILAKLNLFQVKLKKKEFNLQIFKFLIILKIIRRKAAG